MFTYFLIPLAVIGALFWGTAALGWVPPNSLGAWHALAFLSLSISALWSSMMRPQKFSVTVFVWGVTALAIGASYLAVGYSWWVAWPVRSRSCLAYWPSDSCMPGSGRHRRTTSTDIRTRR